MDLGYVRVQILLIYLINDEREREREREIIKTVEKERQTWVNVYILVHNCTFVRKSIQYL